MPPTTTSRRRVRIRQTVPRSAVRGGKRVQRMLLTGLLSVGVGVPAVEFLRSLAAEYEADQRARRAVVTPARGGLPEMVFAPLRVAPPSSGQGGAGDESDAESGFARTGSTPPPAAPAPVSRPWEVPFRNPGPVVAAPAAPVAPQGPAARTVVNAAAARVVHPDVPLLSAATGAPFRAASLFAGGGRASATVLAAANAPTSILADNGASALAPVTSAAEFHSRTRLAAPAGRAVALNAPAPDNTWQGPLASDTPSPTANWTDSRNWIGGAPVNNGTADVSFGPARSTTTSTVDVSYAINSLAFQPTASAYTIDASAAASPSPAPTLTINAGGVFQDSAIQQRIAVPTILGAAQTWDVSDANGSLFHDSSITGAGGLTKTGPGTLTFGGSSNVNDFGPTIVRGGTLELFKDGVVNAISGDLTVGNEGAVASATPAAVVRLLNFEQTGSNTNVTVHPDGLFDLTSSNGEGTNSTSTTIGNLTMTGGEVRIGNGTLTLQGNVVTNASPGAALISSTDFFNDLNLSVEGDRTFTVANGAALYDLDVQAGITNGGLVKNGAGVLRLAGQTNSNLFVTLNAGAIAVADDNALGTLGEGGGGEGRGGVRLNAYDPNLTYTTFTLAGGNLTADGGARTIGNPVNFIGSATIGASLDGSVGAFNFVAALTATGSNTLTVNNTAATVFSGPIYLPDNGTLTVAGTGVTTFAGIVSDASPGSTPPPGPGALAKNGPGTLILSNNNTYTGGTTLNAGTIELDNDNALGTSTFTVNGGAIANNADASGTPFPVAVTIPNAVVLNGNVDRAASNADLTFTGPVSLGGATRTISASDPNFNDLVFSGVISGTSPGAGLTFANGATDSFRLQGTAANTYTGTTTVDNASLFLAKTIGTVSIPGDLTVQNNGFVNTIGGQLASTTNLVVNTGGRFDATNFFNGGNETIASLNGDSTGFVSFGSQFSKTFLTVGQGNYPGTIQDGNLTSSRGPAPAAAPTTGGELVKNTSGTLILSGNNTYTGGTTITGGLLLVNNDPNNGSSGTGAGPVDVSNGTLGGTGRIAGDVTVGTGEDRAALAPGNVASFGVLGVAGAPGLDAVNPNVGTLTVAGSVAFNSVSFFEVELDSNNAAADLLIVFGGVTINTGAMFSGIDLGNALLAAGTSFTLIDNRNEGFISGVFSNLADGAVVQIGSNTFTADYEGGNGNDLVLFNAVPEPGTVTLLLTAASIGGLGIAARRRRSR